MRKDLKKGRKWKKIVYLNNMKDIQLWKILLLPNKDNYILSL